MKDFYLRNKGSGTRRENIRTVLSALFWTRRQIEEDELRLAKMRAAAAGGGAVDYTKTSIHGGTPQTMGDKIIYLVDFERQLQADVDKHRIVAARAMAVIEGVEDERLKLLLTLRYREFRTWAEIGQEMHYSWRHTMRVHKLALKAADKVWRDLEKKGTNTEKLS